MRILFSSIILIVLSYQFLFSQNTNYKLVKEEQGIQIFAREMECHDNLNGIHQLFYQLQFINTTNLQATITWNIDTWMNGACVTCNKPKTDENTYTIELPPSGSIEGNCDKNTLKGLKVYIKQIQNNKSAVLSKFEIVNFKVEFHE
jgi:hypothetical protein